MIERIKNSDHDSIARATHLMSKWVEAVTALSLADVEYSNVLQLALLVRPR